MIQAPGKLAQAPAVPHIVTELPGPKARAHLEFDRQWTSPSVPRAYPVVPIRGEGCTIEDIDGNLLLDFNAGIAVTSTGHCHPDVVRAIQDQAASMIHYSADFYLPIYAEMCAEMARIAPMKEKCRVFLSNSGTEAVEGAIKLARFATKRQYLVSFLGAFHGRSYGSVSLTASKAKYHAGFGPMLPGVFHAPYGHVADLKWFDEVLFDRLVPPDEVAAIIVEPIQGEGGFNPAPASFLRELRALCDENGILLIADEIQTGIARTGRMWAFEHAGIVPDVVCVAKALCNGMPIGAIVTRFELQERWGVGAHGTTFGGNPVSCAAGVAVMRTIEEQGLVANAAARGAELLTGLRALMAADDRIGDVRGLGLMVGVEFVKDRATRDPDTETCEALIQTCADQGLLVLNCGTHHNVIRFLPPIDVTAEEIATGMELFRAGLKSLPRSAA